MLRKTIVRVILILMFIALGVLLLFTGKGHTLLLDNKSVTLNGKAYAALPAVTVAVDSQKPLRLGPGERERVVVKGVQHTITVTVDGKQIVRRFSLPFADMFLCSLPALRDDNGKWCEVYRAENAEPSVPAAPSTEDSEAILPE